MSVCQTIGAILDLNVTVSIEYLWCYLIKFKLTHCLNVGCECSLSGSQSNQCEKSTGNCVCIPGISGVKCDRCARGFTGTAPHCEACGECFDNWDIIVQKLKNETLVLLDKARAIKQTGTTGAYTKQFTQIEENLKEVEKILQGQDINEMDLDKVRDMIADRKNELNSLKESLAENESQLESTKTNILNVNFKLEMLRNKSDELEEQSKKLKEEATLLQEANVEGAYNITKDAQRRSRASQRLIQESANILEESKTRRENTEKLIEQAKGRQDSKSRENELALNNIQKEINKMEFDLKSINSKVCGGEASISSCNAMCGGAGCNRCGGISCVFGATTKASNALDMADKSERALKEKNRIVNDELRRIHDAKVKSDEALNEAKMAYEQTMSVKNATTSTAIQVKDMLDQIDKFLEKEAAQPSDIRQMAEKCLAAEISLDPQEITNLAREINTTIAGLKNIDIILIQTKGSLDEANNLKIKAQQAK